MQIHFCFGVVLTAPATQAVDAPLQKEHPMQLLSKQWLSVAICIDVTGQYLIYLCMPGEAGSLGKEAARQLVRGVIASVLSCPK